jgi:SAM-dependent methyltransferase
MDRSRFFDSLDAYFAPKLEEHGATPLGVDWNSDAAQTIRFEQLAKVLDASGPYSLIDYGCGYGALAPWLAERGHDVAYTGFDVSERMLEVARRDDPAWRYTSVEAELEPADFVVASGVFNLRLEIDDDAWTQYIDETLATLSRLGRRGFAFNMLTSYSDLDKRRANLFYGDPCRFFDLCKRAYSKDVALLHDYGLYEFTILVRR